MQIALIASNKPDTKSIRRLLTQHQIEYDSFQDTPLTTYISSYSDIGNIINIITETRHTLLEETEVIIKW